MNITIPRPAPEMLWREGAELTCDELSGLLQECTGYAVEQDLKSEDPAFYVLDLCGDRIDDGYPFPDLETVEDFVGWRIDEALANA